MQLVHRIFEQRNNGRGVGVADQLSVREAARSNSAGQHGDAESVQIIVDRLASLLGRLNEDDRKVLLKAAQEMSTL